MPNSPDGITSGDPYPGIEEIQNVQDAIRDGLTERLDAGELTLSSMINMINSVGDSYMQGLIAQAMQQAQNNCFGPEVPIDIWPLDPEFAPDPNNPYKQYDQDAVHAKI